MNLDDLQTGDRVALLAPGSVAYVELVIDLLAGGIVPVPLDPKLTPAERERILPYVDPALVIEGDEALQHARLNTEHAPVSFLEPAPCT